MPTSNVKTKILYLSVLLGLVLALPLLAEAQVPDTNSTNTGAITTVSEATVPDTSSTNTGDSTTVTSSGSTVPGTSSTNTGATAYAPGSSSTNTGSGGSTVPGTSSTNTGSTVTTVPGTSSTNTGSGATSNNTGSTVTVPGTSSTNTGTSGATIPGTSTTNTGSGGDTTIPGTSTTNTGSGTDDADDNPPPASETPASTGGGGGGGGAVILFATPCADVTYGEWSAPFNGVQYRNIISQTPPHCVITSFQEQARSRLSPVVLGVKIYPNGSLLRTPDKKIYVIINGQKKHIRTWAELLKNYKNKPIENVSYEVLAQYPNYTGGEVLGVKTYGSGSLLRTPDKKIYVIMNGRRSYIKNWNILLKKYRGKPINNVSYEVLTQYPDPV